MTPTETVKSRVDEALQSLSSLDDPLRRRLYEYVVEAIEPVSRDDGATATDIGRTLAAYHLDKFRRGFPVMIDVQA